MSLDTAVDGDPGSCRRGPGGCTTCTVSSTRPLLLQPPALGRAHFDGVRGCLPRAVCRDLPARRRRRESCRGLGRALDEYADGLDEVIAVMARARELARRELVLHGHTIPTPGGYATDRQRHVYRTVAALVAGARGEESLLRDAWLGALARYAVGPSKICACRPWGPLRAHSRRVRGSGFEARRWRSSHLNHRVGFGAYRWRCSHLNQRGHPYHRASDSVWVPWGGGDAA